MNINNKNNLIDKRLESRGDNSTSKILNQLAEANKDPDVDWD